MAEQRDLWGELDLVNFTLVNSIKNVYLSRNTLSW
jgi:hypothetical protein